MSRSPIHIIIALPAEARPLIRGLELSRDPHDGVFPLYHGRGLHMIVSGVGRTKAQAAVQHLYMHTKPKAHACPSVWLNIGIAGHAQADVGTPLLAHTLTDESTGTRWTLPTPAAAPCESDVLTTLEKPDFSYRHSGMIDMEASGFLMAARTITDSSHVHCLKIISDNPRQSASAINGRFVSSLISDKLDLITQLLGLFNESEG